MRDWLTTTELEQHAGAYDEGVRLSAGLDSFCSQSAFVIAAFLGLQPGRTLRAAKVDDAHFVAFAEREAALFGDPRMRTVWEPLEAMWGLACPLVGPDPIRLGRALAEQVAGVATKPIVLLCGMPKRSARLHGALAALHETHRLLEATPTERMVASLEGGTEGFLARRSAKFRANLRRADRAATALGVVQEEHAPTKPELARSLYARAVAVDDRSWKGRGDVGLRASGLYAFYAELLPRLAITGSLRMYFLTLHGTDVAYLFGGLFGDTFRGLQFAFASGHEHASLGNVAQLRAIGALSRPGSVAATFYDLGTAADYKRGWAEIVDETASVLASPR